MNRHNLIALALAVVAAGWSQILIAVGQGQVPIPPADLWLFQVFAAMISFALTALTPYFKWPEKSD